MTRFASQVVDCISCHPTGVDKVDGIDALETPIFSIFVKSRKLSGYAAVLVASACPP